MVQQTPVPVAQQMSTMAQQTPAVQAPEGLQRYQSTAPYDRSVATTPTDPFLPVQCLDLGAQWARGPNKFANLYKAWFGAQPPPHLPLHAIDIDLHTKWYANTTQSIRRKVQRCKRLVAHIQDRHRQHHSRQHLRATFARFDINHHTHASLSSFLRSIGS
jgi:hypothetical protein